MSNSEWKDLPDWTKPEEYAFLEGAKPEVWAWEFLRRIKAYRYDWDCYAPIVKKAKEIAGKSWRYSKWVMHYSPPKLDENESYVAWRSRILLEDGEPVRAAIHVYFPMKWGVKDMASYNQPYGEHVRFRQHGYQYPRLIRDEDSFSLLTEERGGDPEAKQPEAYVIAVRPDKAVFAFDLTAPLQPQKKRLAVLLKQHYAEMKKYEKIKRTGIPKQLTDHLTRHLQVLDAKRTQPDISNANIAKALGFDDYTKIGDQTDVGAKTASQQGCRWLEQAENVRDGYLGFLIEPESTSKK